jgi:hypothetical protein
MAAERRPFLLEGSKMEELPEYHEAEQAKEFIENEEFGMRCSGWIDYDQDNCICVNPNTCTLCFYENARILLKYYGMYSKWTDKADFEHDLRMEDESDRFHDELNSFYKEIMDQEYDSDPEDALWTEQDEMMRLNDILAVEREEIA